MSCRPLLFVTGAARNVGFAVACRFAREGYDICLTSRSQADADAAAARITAEFPSSRVLGIRMDPGVVEDIYAAFEKADAFSPRLDALVCVATANRVGSILEATPEQFDEMYKANTRGYYFCVQQAAKRMKERAGGAMVLFSSLTSHRASPNISLYAMSKGGVDVLSRNAAYEFAKYGIRCNLLLSGPIETEQWRAFSPQELARRRSMLPAGRESRPEETANCVYFLCSDQTPTVTGCEYIVDSGLNLSLRNYDPHWDEK